MSLPLPDLARRAADALAAHGLELVTSLSADRERTAGAAAAALEQLEAALKDDRDQRAHFWAKVHRAAMLVASVGRMPHASSPATWAAGWRAWAVAREAAR